MSEIMGPTDTSKIQTHFCILCGGPGTTKHHLFPRVIQRHLKPPTGKHWPIQDLNKIRLCSTCHHLIHILFGHYELAMTYNTLEKLKPEFLARKQNLRVDWYKE